MLLPKQNISSDERALLKLYSGLTQQDRLTLKTFAEFLAARNPVARIPVGDDDSGGKDKVNTEPKLIPKPAQETVVGAIKRLSETYYMLDRSELLNETSSLMTAHIIQGRATSDVIDDLETLFVQYYKQHNSP